MLDTYCGNSCETCELRQQLSCRGCKLGPGHPFTGWCEIAACCAEKDHNSCESCIKNNAGCSKLPQHKNAPHRWVQKRNEISSRKQKLDQTAPILSKHLWVLFWLIIPILLFDFLSIIGQHSPVLKWISVLVTAVCNLFMSLALIKLSSINKGYRNAGICILLSVGIMVVDTFISPDNQGSLSIIAGTLCAVLGVYGRYSEWFAHSDELLGLDDQLAKKWRQLFKHYAYVVLGMIVICLLFVIGLHIFVLFIGLVAIAVIYIKSYIYRYQTVRCFSEYVSSQSNSPV